jgi:hypothetical protein
MTIHSFSMRRRFQRGSVVRGAVVMVAIVAALGLQLAGPRLQGRLAALAGIDWCPPAAMPAAAMPSTSTSSCGSPSTAFPMHPCKVATATAAGIAPVI